MERHSFALEHLEGRTLFSVIATMDAVPVMTTTAVPVITQATAAVAVPFPSPFNVAGTFAHPIGPIGNPDSGSLYTFKGAGNTKTLGAFSFKGNVHLPGFIATARATGQFTITTAHGTIRISVIGPSQAPGSLPPTLSFTITKGSGAYVNSKGKGTILVSASGATSKFLFRFKPTT